MLKIFEISSYERFKELKEAWDNLSLKSMADNIFLSYDWIDTYIKHFGKDARILILNVYKDNMLVGIAPLMIKRFTYCGLPSARILCFIGMDIADRLDFIIDGDRREILAAMLDYAIRLDKEWDFADFHGLADYTNTFEIIEDWLCNIKMPNISGPLEKYFYINFNGKKDFFSWKFSKRFYRRLKKINNRNYCLELEFRRHIDDLKDGKETKLFADIDTIKSHSYRGMKGKSIFSRENVRNFHREIFSRFLKNGWIDLLLLRSNNRPIAFMYNYFYNGRIYNYSMEFDKRYSFISPGTMLMYWAIKDSAERRCMMEFDFIKGEELWKTRFTAEYRIHGRIRIFKNSFYSRLLYYLSKVIFYLRRNKFIYSIWNKLKEI